jgi:hypothetical protein
MRKRFVVCTLLGMSVGECFCPAVTNHYQPHAPHVEQVELVRTVAEYHVSGVLPPGYGNASSGSLTGLRVT